MIISCYQSSVNALQSLLSKLICRLFNEEISIIIKRAHASQNTPRLYCKSLQIGDEDKIAGVRISSKTMAGALIQFLSPPITLDR
jgi:hypothetical protein